LGLQRSVDLYNHSLFQTFFVWFNMCACIRKKVERFVNFIFTIYQGVKEFLDLSALQFTSINHTNALRIHA